MEEQEGNFSKKGEDTFDPKKGYVGIRLQKGVPLLDRDWNELEDIRRYEEWKLRKWYVGNGTPDDGFKISAVGPRAKHDFKIKAGRCLVDGFDVVNDKDILYSKQKDVAALNPPSEGVREDTVYLDVWIEEVTHKEEPALENPQDVNVPTCVRHKLEWRVRVDEGSERHEKEDCHHYYDLAEIRWENKEIIEVKDLRTTKLKLVSIKNGLEDVRKATANRWINGGEMKVTYYREDKYTFSIYNKMLCIISGQEINFDLTSKEITVKERENCAVVVVRATDETTEPEIEFIITRRNLLEWLNSWTLDKWLPAEDTEPVLKSTFTLPLYFFERRTGGSAFKITDLRPHGVLDMWLAELDGRLDSRERRMCRVPLLQQTILGRTVPVATVPVGLEPSGIAFDGAHIWVAHLDQIRVSKIDINTNEEVAEVDVGGATCGVAFDGTHIWVAHVDKHVSKIDILKDTKVAQVEVGVSPCGVAFDGTHIWVTNSDDNTVSKIDILEDKKVAVDVGGATCGVAFDGTHIWVALLKDSKVSKIDINTNDVVATVDVGAYPWGVAFDGTHIWVTNSNDNNVSKIDILKDTKVAQFEVGVSPCGVAFDGTHIWVAVSKDSNVSKIDINTNEVVATVDVGGLPRGVAFDGTHIWVANEASNNVSKILRGDLK
jgi:YVTN family beta-propeller protein